MSAYGFTLVYLVAAGLLLSSLSRTNVLFRVMNFRPLRSLGKYSYGFYVYHVLLRPILIEPWGKLQSHWAFRVSLCLEFLVVFAVSVASYHFLEMPFLKLKDRFSAAVRTMRVICSRKGQQWKQALSPNAMGTADVGDCGDEVAGWTSMLGLRKHP